MSLNRIVPEMRKSKKSSKLLSLSPDVESDNTLLRKPKKALLSSHLSSMVSTSRGTSDQKITINSTPRRLKNNVLLRNESLRSASFGHSIPYIGNQKRVRKNHLITKVQTGTGDVGSSYNAPDIAEVDLPVWHRMTEITFESFLYQIDGILSKLQIKEYSMLNFSSSIPRYQDICQKLRIEILLALDKLNLLAMPNFKYTKEEGELLHNLNNLKGQLSNLRGQYHSLIKNFGPKVHKRPFR